jgi:ubiquinone/menaquinone biosynthesis C-methylase UbiE
MRDPEIERLGHIFGESGVVPVEGGKWDDERPGNQAIFLERTARLQSLLQSAGISLEGRSVLEVGCGTGRSTTLLETLGVEKADLWGVDLFSRPLRLFRSHHPEVHLSQQDGAHLAFGPRSFDVVVLFTVMSSIKDEGMRRRVVAETARVLKPEGLVLWYELRFRNPRNPDVMGLDRASVTDLFSDFDCRFQSATLLPPVARRLGPLARSLYRWLVAIPWLRSHYVGVFALRSESLRP